MLPTSCQMLRRPRVCMGYLGMWLQEICLECMECMAAWLLQVRIGFVVSPLEKMPLHECPQHRGPQESCPGHWHPLQTDRHAVAAFGQGLCGAQRQDLLVTGAQLESNSIPGFR